MHLYKYLISFSFCVIVISCVKAQEGSIEDLRQSYVNLIMECAKEHQITSGELDELKSKRMPEDGNAKCLFACAYKKAGMMDEEGYMSVAGIEMISDKFLAGDLPSLTKAKQFIEACKSVNEEKVGDGAQGCDRAALMFKCSVEKAPETMTDAEVKLALTKKAMSCMKDHKVDTAELMKMQLMTPPKSKQAHCLLACAYKKEGWMNAQGLYDTEHMYKIAEIMKEGDEQRVINGRKVVEICAKVNEVQVSDGEKGCERAGLIFKCVVVNAPKFGFKL
ncbi:uncharacterized protein LOC113238374 [Hyposmocoma kahamanoa]|uniref:uncharacterized protein LOC113238374 n=1 Tax=Hyposmocoma kahamanoa TaxID=1477025 RepID=UPI000E6DA509|nr:uncharacterized protein LOC113238374 [Hyposmocoma kahamanoa]